MHFSSIHEFTDQGWPVLLQKAISGQQSCLSHHPLARVSLDRVSLARVSLVFRAGAFSVRPALEPFPVALAQFHFSFLLVLLVLLCHSSVAEILCNFTTKDGSVYDFSALKNENADYFIPRNNNNHPWDVWINLCRPLLTTVCGTSMGACQQWDTSPQGKAGMGVASTLTFAEGDGYISGTMTQGDDGRTAEIIFLCDPAAGIGAPAFINENPARFYEFKWASAFACAACPGYDCQSCTMNGTCRWCLDNGKCITSNDQTCSDYISTPSFCPTGCSSHRSCAGCTSNGCAWCLDNDKCINPKNPDCNNKISKGIYCNLQD